MSILNLRGTGTRRAVDRVAELRDENVKLLTRQTAADDFFAIQSQLITDLEDDVRKLTTRAETAERTVRQLEDLVRLRDRQIDDLQRRITVGVNAEHVIAKTQPIPVAPLWQPPMAAVTNPVHLPRQMTWGLANDDTQPIPRSVTS